MPVPLISEPLLLAYLLVFGVAALAREDCDSEHLEAVAAAHARMEELIEDVLTLAHQGQPIDETETVDLSAVAAQCWLVVETTGAELITEDDLTATADVDRLQQLLENLFETQSNMEVTT